MTKSRSKEVKMRIWYQSSTSLGKDPLWSPYEQSLKRHVQDVARSNVAVDVHGVDIGTNVDAAHYFEYLHTSQIINAAIRAEREGYDAFTVGCMNDPGFFEIREVIDIPVAFIGETSVYLACLLAPKFCPLAPNEASLLRFVERVKRYGLEERVVAASSLGFAMNEVAKGFAKPEPLINAAKEAAKRAVKQGAAMLVTLCNVLNMVLVDHGIREIEGLPILDTAGAVVKMTELMVDLKKIGITRSRMGLFAAPSKEELATVRKSYGIADTSQR